MVAKLQINAQIRLKNVKKRRLCLFFTKNVLPLSSLKATGTLDEWLSQRSAKPCTAVRIRQVPQRVSVFWDSFLFLTHPDIMADNYLEKKMEQHRAAATSRTAKGKNTLSVILERNRSTRGYDSSFIVRSDQLRRIVSVNTRVASARNRQVLRFRLVTADEAHKVLPHVSMGAGLSDMRLPLQGTEPNAFIVVCSSIEPRTSTYIDLGISVQSMLLQAVEIGLNGLCIMSFDKDAIMSSLGLQLEPLMVVAIGKSAEKHTLVEISADEPHDYYRNDGVHYVPKVCVEDLIIKQL